MKIGLVAYRAGNVRSIQSALETFGVKVLYSDQEQVLRQAAGLVFPGVAAAPTAMADLRERGLADWLLSWDRPFLGICLGMQLLCRFTEEGEVPLLGLFPYTVKRFTAVPRQVHMGWNFVQPMTPDPLWHRLEKGEFFYFVHSYRVMLGPETIAQATYGEPFSAALRKKNFWGVQFHPEKSGKAGMRLLENFLRLCRS